MFALGGSAVLQNNFDSRSEAKYSIGKTLKTRNQWKSQNIRYYKFSELQSFFLENDLDVARGSPPRILEYGEKPDHEGYPTFKDGLERQN